ncbi:hypothetical protein [Novosphingobium sp. FKTRR1]|uniref:hypothetical protein n=1 Tax=Novosphingobium sp. FKTRR1 TaxID=2879118 RepID=UPI001CF04518|nr:hypothetical protein [Novosphingobium sp. FKTRR1]
MGLVRAAECFGLGVIGLRRPWFRPTPALALPPRQLRSVERIGWLEGVHDGWLRGWAHDPIQPGKPARIQISGGATGGTITVLADHYRADVQAAGHGLGVCGFAVPVGAMVADPIEARWADTGEPLPGSPWRAGAAKAPLEGWRGSRIAVFDPPLPGSATLTGFALDTADPPARLEVMLVAGEHRFGPVRACRHAALARTLGGDGFHGFYLPWNPAVLAETVEPELRDARDDALLLKLNRTWARSVGLA